jgi:hypothetical protein
MPIIPEIQDRLILAFPRSSNAMLFRAVQEGSFLADHLYDGESFLNNKIGRDLRGHIRRIGISNQIEKYCTRGDLPFVTSMKPMPKGNWHWLEIISTGALAHVCRTEDVFKFPDEAESRQDLRLSIQPDLLVWTAGRERELGKIIAEIPKLYTWLTFRIAQDGRISHLCWASPAADNDEWLAHINVSDDIAKSGSAPPPPPTTPDPKESLRLKDHVAQALEQAADKKTGA